MTEGVKHDHGKPATHLLPTDALEEIAKVLAFGAAKHGERNWELGMAWHQHYGALLRHIWAWWRGKDLDEESGLPHLAHAGCRVLFLLSYKLRGIGDDDRPKT